MTESNIEKLEKKLQEYFHNQEEVICGYLFGSSIGASCGWKKTPDIDIAVLVDEQKINVDYWVLQWRMKQELTNLLKRKDIDVVILNHAPSVLCHEVIKRKRVIFERDREKRLDFEVSSELKFYDFAPYRKLFWDCLVKRIKEGWS